MNNMKISAKLALSFMIVLMLSVVIGVTGIIGLKNVGKLSTAMYERQTMPLTYMSRNY